MTPGVAATDPARLAAIDRTIAVLTAHLLDCRTEAGYWEGRLATSALSTAVAIVALIVAEQATGDIERLVRSGCEWLARHQNADGGWGDTVGSLSNISTTTLCWSALTLVRDCDLRGAPASPSSLVPGSGSVLRPSSLVRSHEWTSGLSTLNEDQIAREVVLDQRGQASSDESPGRDQEPCTKDQAASKAQERFARTIDCAESWLRREVGAVDAERVAHAIIERYGADRTFSIPILATMALAGRLGSGVDAWKTVPQLPFELAACPPAFFRWLRLPVVSYALPALVALGQLRHHYAPTRNVLLRAIRSSLRKRTLDAARRMQPDTGGFLEATPLTAFVVMGLAASGQAAHPIARDGIGFLKRSARTDGGWPIDTNLATWVTTLSVKALHDAGALGDRDRDRVLEWLLNQQVAHEHPFTHAKPGGWAWTDLSGGVPDADDTAGALVAVRQLGGPKNVRAATAGVEWLLDLQNRDGGIPTFCRGWGRLPFDRSAPDLTAHAIEAWDAWLPFLPAALQRQVRAAAGRAVAYLARTQHADGTWTPLWFGNQRAAGEANLTYGSSRAVIALGTALARGLPRAQDCRQRAILWLLRAQEAPGGWGGMPGVPSSIEETGLALHALAVIPNGSERRIDALRRGVDWLIDTTEEGLRTPPSPIGLYFARLWYHEELYPVVFALRGLVHAREALSGRSAS